MDNWHSLDKKEVLKELKTSEEGLSAQEARSRLQTYGKNELKQISKVNPLIIFLTQFNSVFIYILLVAALFSFLIKHYLDFTVILAVVLVNSFVGFFQQYKAEKTIQELKQILVPKVKVLRNNRLVEIFSSDLVPGDIISISEGDKVMADCRIIHSNDIQANEAILTGESFPSNKHSEIILKEVNLHDRVNMLFMGTTITKGNGKAVVVSTGMKTEFGKIAGLVQTLKIEKTPLEKKLDSFSKNVAVVIIILTAIVTLFGVLKGEELSNMLLTGMALAISVIPEGIPAVIAITLALAIKRMHKNNALIRKLPAAETLGRTTVICTDKTGTLTLEEMTVEELYCNKKIFKVEDHSLSNVSKKDDFELKTLLKIGILCNNARIEGNELFGDPTEKALILSAKKLNLLKKEETEKEARVKEFAFSSKRKIMSIVRKSDEGLISYVKGAPDVVLKKCTKELINGRLVPLNKERKTELLIAYDEMASKALRVLAFAFRKVPSIFDENIAEDHLIFVGFQGMLDPPRKEIKAAVQECKTAGIKVKILTGDSLLTARAVADMIGLDGEAIEGHNLENASEEEFKRIVKEKTIFARINPEIKYKIIKSFKSQNEVVAVTGDGVNDVLALKEAHIGIAMGIRGTDVAREVSDIILLDDNFDSIIKAVHEGRRVYDNMKKTIKFYIAANVDELLVILIALLLSLPLPLMPLAILWMNLITDSLPNLSLSVEKEEENIMKRKPTNPSEHILDGIWSFIVIAGIISCIATLALFILYYQSDLEKARTMALTTSVFYEMFLVFTCRSDKNIWEIGIFSNKFLIISVILAVILQLIAIYTPLSAVFGFKALSLSELLLVTGASSLGLIFFEFVKYIKPKSTSI